MKKLLSILILFFSLQSFAQQVIKDVNKTGNVDTLFAPVGKTVIYKIAVEGEASYLKEIAVTNTNNVYSYRLGTGGLAWVGRAGSKLDIIKGKGIIIKITY